MRHDEYESIENTKKGFEEILESGTFYNRQTQDREHLELILSHLKVTAGMKILDLGTGTGYLAFPIAGKYPEAEVTGLDIVENALIKNREKAEKEELRNLNFLAYDGMTFPFADETFDMVITRYALHHFPVIYDTFQEISRVLKPGGKFFLSDPAPNDDDTGRFVDAYMQMKKDGHIKFYTRNEWLEIGRSVCLDCIDDFETSIRFPKKKQTALDFDAVLKRFDEDVIRGYELEVAGDEIWITERVNNLMFQKSETVPCREEYYEKNVVSIHVPKCYKAIENI